MDRGTPRPEASDSGNLPTGDCACANPGESSATYNRKIAGLGRAFVKTIRHFWPGYNEHLNQLPDTRFAPFVEYHTKFLAWWGLVLFPLKLGSRRQLDFDLGDDLQPMLHNVNRRATGPVASAPTGI